MELNVPSLLVDLILGMVAICSLVVWSKIISRLRARQSLLSFRQRRSPSWNVFAVLLAALWIVSHLVLVVASMSSIGDGPVELNLQAVQSDCVLKITLVLILLTLLTRLGQQPLSEFGLHTDELRQQVAEGIIGFFASLLPVFLLLILELPLRSEETQHSLLRLLEQDHGPTTLVWIFAAVVVLAPLAEELVFRVVLQGWLQTRISPVWAICLVAALSPERSRGARISGRGGPTGRPNPGTITLARDLKSPDA